MAGNPVKGVKRSKMVSAEGKTPAIGDHQARSLLAAPDAATLQGKRDRAILSTLLYHGLRRAELRALMVGDVHPRRGVIHFRVHGKGGKLRYLPLHRKRPALPSAAVDSGRFVSAERKQVVDVAVAASRQFLKGAFEPGGRIQAVEFGGAEQGLDCGGATTGALRACVEPVLAVMETLL